MSGNVETIAQIIRDRFLSICAGAFLFCVLAFLCKENFGVLFDNLSSYKLETSGLLVMILAFSFVSHSLLAFCKFIKSKLDKFQSFESSKTRRIKETLRRINSFEAETIIEMKRGNVQILNNKFLRENNMYWLNDYGIFKITSKSDETVWFNLDSSVQYLLEQDVKFFVDEVLSKSEKHKNKNS